MQKLVKHILYVFLWITAFTAIMTLCGVIFVWLSNDKAELPYLKWLLSSVIVEIVGGIILLAKKGVRYLPETRIDKQSKDTLDFMHKFISEGTSATVVSNRVSWLAKSPALISQLQAKVNSGINIEIITPKEVESELKETLKGVSFIVTGEAVSPKARFTLINGGRDGAEKLAIARGVHPEHEITIFDNNSGPQIIAMAKDIVEKSKDLAKCRKDGRNQQN